MLPLLALLCGVPVFAQGRIAPSALPSYKSLTYAPLPPLHIPEPKVVTLSNGMRIYMLEDHELPLVHGVAIIRTGNLFDPPDKRGLAELTGSVLRSGGTKDKTGDEIDVELENIAASVESGIGESSGTMSFSCLKENTGEVLGVFHDLMTEPQFRQDKLDLAKTHLRSSISRRNDDPSGIASREFANILYGRNTPYGWDIEYEHVNRIQRQDLVDFYRRYYFPANVMLGIYGDFSTAEMKARLEKLFGGWTATEPPVPKVPVVTAAPDPGVFVAQKPDVTQTFFRIGHLGGVLSDKDYPALAVAADILGGGFSSRLFKRVRTELGYAYDIGSYWGAGYDHPGLFEISGSTQSKYTVATIQASIEEMKKMRTTRVTDEELKTAKDTVLNSFVFNFDRPSKTLNRMLVYNYYAYPHDFIFRYQKAIEAVTAADIQRVCEQYFKPQDLTIVAVGNPKDFGTPLSALGLKEHTIDLTIPDDHATAAAANPATRDRAVQLAARVRTALGGADKLAAVKDVDVTADVDVQGPGGSVKGSQRNIFLLPSSMRQELNLPFAKQTVYSDGVTGWIAGPRGLQAMPPPVLKQVKGETYRELDRLIMTEPKGLTSEGALEFDDGQGETVRLAIDDKTALPLKLSYESAGMGGKMLVEETFGDWRDVNGIKVPFERSVVQGGRKFADVHVRVCKMNTGITPEELSNRAGGGARH